MDLGIWTNPWCLVSVLLMPLAIIGLAKSWKRFKDKRAEAEGKEPHTANQ